VNLIIDAFLCEPPSEVSCFRDVTLYAKTFVFEDVLLQCPHGTRSIYWRWLKQYGAHDFISYLLLESEDEYGFVISDKKSNLNIDKISASNLNFIISTLQSLNQKKY